MNEAKKQEHSRCVRVRLFGLEARVVGTKDLEVEVSAAGTSVQDLKAAMVALQPRLAGRLAGCRLAVNHEFVTDTARVHPADEVALIGPVSGG
jgi:molybdopterin converting factor small subunit